MLTSGVLGARLVTLPAACPKRPSVDGSKFPCGGSSLAIECSSRPQKKATKHHMKTRPRKTQPWDINRKPTVRTPLPPLPPDWTLVEASPTAPPPLSLEVTDSSS